MKKPPVSTDGGAKGEDKLVRVRMIRLSVALVVLLVALLGLANSLADMTGLLYQSVPGQKADPGTVGQQYQGPKHYKNHNYYIIDCFNLQGGESGE